MRERGPSSASFESQGPPSSAGSGSFPLPDAHASALNSRGDAMAINVTLIPEQSRRQVKISWRRRLSSVEYSRSASLCTASLTKTLNKSRGRVEVSSLTELSKTFRYSDYTRTKVLLAIIRSAYSHPIRDVKKKTLF